MNPERPLDGIRSLKVKLGVLVAASIFGASLVAEIGDRAGVPAWLTIPVTIAAGLGVTQWLARGMTSPLREMTAAAGRMATGDYSLRVTASSADEVGTLGAAFNTMAADLADADRQRRQLVATVSHELRTPLAAQQALLENLVDGVVRPDEPVLRTALLQAERLGALVGDLLDLSRLDGGPVPLDLAPVRVADLVRVAVAEAAVSGRPVEHVIDVRPADLVVQADAARLAQVLANLLDNAGRHSPVGGKVRVTATDDGPDRWALDVTDEGPGISRDRAERIFDRFGSGDDASGGTGIGLAIASWVCELHGGSISAPTPDGGARGARIRAVLPRRPAPPGAPQRDRPGTPPTSPTAPPVSPAPPGPASASGQPAEQPAGPPRPVLDTVFGDLWPETGLTPRVELLLTSIGVGVLAGAILPFRGLGLALLLVLLVGGGVVLRTSVRRRRPWTAVSTVLCLGLLSLVVLRAAEWVTALALLAGIVLTTSALTGARGVVSQLAGLAAWPLSALRGLPLLGRTITATSRVSVLWPIVRTATLSVLALVVFGGLFASGDAIVGSWAGSIVPDLAVDGLVLRSFVGFVVGGSLLAVCYLALNPPRVDLLAAPVGRPVARTWEWLVPVGLVVAIYAAFVVAQAAALFGGHDYVQRTTGLTYAEYVHQGFGQLTVATLLTLVTVAITVRKAPVDTGPERLVLRLVLGALCLLTLVVVGSALHRMDLYQQAYGFTVLRVLVDAFELWLGLLVLLVVVAGVRLRGRWLPRAALLSAAVLVLGAGLANPEGWVAERNIDRYVSSGRFDPYYLRSLSADATPAIVAGLPGDLARCIARAPAPDEGWLSWNGGRNRARAVLGGGAATGPEGLAGCAELLDAAAAGGTATGPPR